MRRDGSKARKLRLFAAWAAPWVPAGIDLDAPLRMAAKVVLLIAGIAASGAVIWALEVTHRQELALMVRTAQHLSRREVPRPGLRRPPGG